MAASGRRWEVVARPWLALDGTAVYSRDPPWSTSLMTVVFYSFLDLVTRRTAALTRARALSCCSAAVINVALIKDIDCNHRGLRGDGASGVSRVCCDTAPGTPLSPSVPPPLHHDGVTGVSGRDIALSRYNRSRRLAARRAVPAQSAPPPSDPALSHRYGTLRAARLLFPGQRHIQ